MTTPVGKTQILLAKITGISLLLFSLNNFWTPLLQKGFTYAPAASHLQTSILSAARLPFIQNIGQLNPEVSYYATLLDGTAFVEQDGTITYSFRADGNSLLVVKEKLSGQLPIAPKGGEKSPAAINSFVGPKENWKTNIPNYKTIEMGEIYAGITLQLQAANGHVEKIFTVHPDGNPEEISLELEGTEKLHLTPSGELKVQTQKGPLSMKAPFAYQEIPGGKVPVEVNYRITGTSAYGFEVGAYDKNIPLIIDPILASTFLGGTGVEGSESPSIAIDSSGKIFVAADTRSSDFPTVTGAYDETFNSGFDDAIISRFSADLSTLEASTFIGGSQSDQPQAIALDSSDNVYITGGTSSSDFPVTAGAYDESFNFNVDAFVAKLTNNLGTLSASTFVGGSSFEVAYDVGISSASPQKVLITGRTQSTDFPTTGGAFDTTLGGGAGAQDIFVSKLDINLTALEASTYIGGQASIGGGSTERGMEVLGDASGNIYVAGYTNETDLPVTTGAYDETHNGNVEAFFGRFDGNLSATGAILSYLGGSSADFILDMELTGTDIYFAGLTSSSNFPTTVGAYSETINGSDAFVSRFSSDLSTLEVSTFFGGSGSDAARAMDIGSTGNVYITGETDSSALPGAGCVSANAGGFDNYIASLSADLDALNGSILVGGSSTELATDIALDSSNNAFITGNTSSSAYPTTSGAYDESFNGVLDLFVTGVSSNLSDIEAGEFCGTQTISSSTLTFQDIPDTFTFGTITAGSSQDLFNNENPPGANQPAAGDLLQIFDDRSSGGFTVTIDPEGTFIDETGLNTIPLANLYIVTSLDETDPGNVGGITYGGGFTGDQTVSAPLYVDVDSASLTSTATYTGLAPSSQFGGSPLVLMDGTLPSTSGRNGTMSTFTDFYLHIDPTQTEGSYALKLTYTLTDSTT